MAEEKLRFTCACGAKLSAPRSAAGRSFDCPACGVPVTAPSDIVSFAPEPVQAPRPRATSVRPRRAVPAGEPGWQRWTRWGLVAALIPLLLSIFVQEEDPGVRLERMMEKDPKLAAELRRAAKERDEVELFRVMPRQRIEGAVHPRFTWVHWAYAALSALIFWLFILVAWPMGTATSTQMWVLGIFTGTAGILLLLGVQWIALSMRGWVISGSLVGILFMILHFIGYSYQAATDPTNGFLASLAGFTFGVGLCEELCKTLPLLWLARRATTLDARGLALLGLATGIGFGVSEGITYSSSFYNGVSGAWIYVVRFVSCVALHAVWSACSGLLLWGMQAEIDDVDRWYDWLLPILKLLGISMALHGLYDTFLKRDLELLAMLTAVASFVWFFWLYERTCRAEAGAAPRAA